MDVSRVETFELVHAARSRLHDEDGDEEADDQYESSGQEDDATTRPRWRYLVPLPPRTVLDEGYVR
jgi:hypothetical protein